MQKNDARTLENNSLIRHPEVSKCPFLIVRFKKYTASLMSENPDISCIRSCIPEFLDRIGCKFVVIVTRRSGEACVEVRVLLEGDTSVSLEPAEIPKDFFHTCFFTEHLCYNREIPRNNVSESTLTLNDVGIGVSEGAREKKPGHLRRPFD
jgi:hypothetical protein